jgi:hypothetical protein
MQTTTLTTLPALGAPLDGGIFIGLVTQPDGAHAAVTLLPDRATGINWKAATDWASGLNAQLPTRQMMCAIRANTQDRPQSGWHWTSEEHKLDASFAWYCDFNDGLQLNNHESYEGAAVAVRLIQVTA